MLSVADTQSHSVAGHMILRCSNGTLSMRLVQVMKESARLWPVIPTGTSRMVGARCIAAAPVEWHAIMLCLSQEALGCCCMLSECATCCVAGGHIVPQCWLSPTFPAMTVMTGKEVSKSRP